MTQSGGIVVMVNSLSQRGLQFHSRGSLFHGLRQALTELGDDLTLFVGIDVRELIELQADVARLLRRKCAQNPFAPSLVKARD